MRTDSMPLIYALFGYAVNVSAPAQQSQSGAGQELVSFFRLVPQFCLFAGWIPWFMINVAILSDQGT